MAFLAGQTNVAPPMVMRPVPRGATRITRHYNYNNTKPGSASSLILANKRVAGANVSQARVGFTEAIALRNKHQQVSKLARRPKTTPAPKRKPVSKSRTGRGFISSVKSLGNKVVSGTKKGLSSVGNFVKEIPHDIQTILHPTLDSSSSPPVKSVPGRGLGLPRSSVVRPGQTVKGLKQGMTVTTPLYDALGQIGRVPQNVGNRVEHIAHDIIKPAVIQATNTVAKPFKAVGSAVHTGVHTIEEKFSSGAKAVENIVTEVIDDVRSVPLRAENLVKSGVNQIQTQIIPGVKTVVKNGIEYIQGHALEPAVHTIEDAGRHIQSAISTAANNVKQFGYDVGEKITPSHIIDTLRRPLDRVGSKIKTGAIALLLGGAVFAFLLWDNTRDARKSAVKFVSRNAENAIQGFAQNGLRLV